MKRLIYVYCVILVLAITIFSCSNKEKQSAPLTPCERYEVYLKGTFESPMIEGTMSFTGGLTGIVDIAGVDFNDITCTYTITDCSGGLTDMNCQGQTHQEVIQVFSADSIQIGATLYLRTGNQ